MLRTRGNVRGQETVRPFLKDIATRVRDCIRAVAMGVHAPFLMEVRAWCHSAEIVYDFFHVAIEIGREVIDRMRVDDTDTREWWGPGDCPAFPRDIGTRIRNRIRAVVMGVHAPFLMEVRAWCHSAAIVYGFFHVAIEISRGAINRMRVDCR